MKFKVLVFFPFVIAACQTGGIGRVGSPAWDLSTSQEQKVAYFSQVCASYGFAPNTPQMAQCIQAEAQGARTSASARASALANNPALRQPQQTTCLDTIGGFTCNSF